MSERESKLLTFWSHEPARESEDAACEWRRLVRMFADELSDTSSPRRTLMQFDLQFEGTDAVPSAQRTQLLGAWLGERLARHRDLSVRDGLISLFPEPDSALLEETSRSPSAGYLENVMLVGTTTQFRRHLDTLARRSHPWLRGLDVACEDGGDIIDSARTAALIAATPCLRVLQVSAHRIFEEFPHPSVRTLTIDGFDAIRSLCGTGAAFPAVVELDLAFQGCGEIRDPWDSTLSQMLLERSFQRSDD